MEFMATSQMCRAFLEETGKTCFSSCLGLQRQGRVKLPGKGERERLGSLSFQSPERTKCRFFKTSWVVSNMGRRVEAEMEKPT